MRSAAGLRDDAQTLDDAGHDDVFLAGVQPLGVFADDDEIDVGVRHVDAGQGAHRPDAGVEVEFLAQPDVDRAEALADRRGARAFEGDAIAADEVERGRRQRDRRKR